jgi:hypothetical protein
MSKRGHVQRSGDMVENGVQQDDTEQGRAYWEDKDVAECRSGGSRDQSHVIRVPEIESIVRWHRVGELRM